MNESLRKARIAYEAEIAISPEQRSILEPKILRIRDLETELSLAMRFYRTLDVCRKCEMKCCHSSIENSIDPETYFYIFSVITADEATKVWGVLESESPDGYCRFLSENGCVLPEDARPQVCKSFFCKQTRDYPHLMQIYHKPLERAFCDLYFQLRQLGIKFS